MISLTDHLYNHEPHDLNVFFRLGFYGSLDHDYRHAYAAACSMIRPVYGFEPIAAPLLTLPADNAKLKKANAYEVGLALNPNTLRIGKINYTVCPHAGDCAAACVAHAGKGGLSTVREGRRWKTQLLIQLPHLFVWRLGKELAAAQRKAGHCIYCKTPLRRDPTGTWVDETDGDCCWGDPQSGANENEPHVGRQLVVRLNTFSDIAWEKVLPAVFLALPDAQFLDYTKDYERAERCVRSRFWPDNYEVAYSWNERSDLASVQSLLRWGGNVSVVADGVDWPELRRMFEWDHIVSADETDEWILEYSGTIGVLMPKGPKIKAAMKRGSKFIVTANTLSVPVSIRSH